MVFGLEDMGIRILLNECEPIVRSDESIYLAGIDDAHYYRVDNIEKAASDIPADAFSILLSHTPEVYRHARRIRPAAERAHPRRSNLFAWFDPNHVVLGATETFWIGGLEVP
jgi:hypothetical protein